MGGRLLLGSSQQWGKSLLGEIYEAYGGTMWKCSGIRDPHSVSLWDGVRLVLLLGEGFDRLMWTLHFLCRSCLCCMNCMNTRIKAVTAVRQVRRTLRGAVLKAREYPIQCYNQLRNFSFITRKVMENSFPCNCCNTYQEVFHIRNMMELKVDEFVEGKDGIKLGDMGKMYLPK